MDGGNWLTILLSLIGGGGAATIVMAFVAWRKSSAEIQQTNAQTENTKAQTDKTRSETEKAEAETTEIITRAAEKALGMLKDQICAMQNDNDKMRAEIIALNARVADLEERFDEVLDGAHVLYAQVMAKGEEPQYKPPERRKKARGA